MKGCNQQTCQLLPEMDSGRKQTVVDWRSMFFQQSYALSFNGINEYVSLPGGCLSQHFAGVPDDDGFTIDMMILAHAIPACPPPGAGTKPCKAVVPPAGGMLLSCQDREFGRSRRAARLETIALLYIGTDGYLYSGICVPGIGSIKSWQCIADDHWHRVTLVLRWTSPYRLNALLYIDGHVGATGHTVHCTSLPHYPVLGSGVTEGCPYGSCTPVYNCHSFHGLIDELRIWARPLAMFEVKELAFRRIVNKHDMPYAHKLTASWSLTEGSGRVIHNHIRSAHEQNQPPCTGQLGAVAIPSAHHTYSTVSKMVAAIPEQALKSSGPEWVVSTAPVEGQLIMEFCDQKVR
ncbi:hypothetical protein ABBQ38_008202 [Trebouxia sp. C0009 RCD-2024]